MHLLKRFQSQRLATEVRWQVLNFPHKVLDEPDAIEILLGSQMPGDVSFQLKVCLIRRVNPMARLTTTVPTVLEIGKPHHGGNVLYAGLRKSSLHHSVCDESA